MADWNDWEDIRLNERLNERFVHAGARELHAAIHRDQHKVLHATPSFFQRLTRPDHALLVPAEEDCHAQEAPTSGTPLQRRKSVSLPSGGPPLRTRQDNEEQEERCYFSQPLERIKAAPRRSATTSNLHPLRAAARPAVRLHEQEREDLSCLVSAASACMRAGQASAHLMRSDDSRHAAAVDLALPAGPRGSQALRGTDSLSSPLGFYRLSQTVTAAGPRSVGRMTSLAAIDSDRTNANAPPPAARGVQWQEGLLDVPMKGRVYRNVTTGALCSSRPIVRSSTCPNSSLLRGISGNASIQSEDSSEVSYLPSPMASRRSSQTSVKKAVHPTISNEYIDASVLALGRGQDTNDRASRLPILAKEPASFMDGSFGSDSWSCLTDALVHTTPIEGGSGASYRRMACSDVQPKSMRKLPARRCSQHHLGHSSSSGADASLQPSRLASTMF